MKVLGGLSGGNDPAVCLAPTSTPGNQMDQKGRRPGSVARRREKQWNSFGLSV